jgi:REG-2-like HAD superfamily hydrolase
MTTVRGLSIDAAGTLLHPAEPISVSYARFSAAHGGRDEVRIAERLAAAMQAARGLRTTPDWRAYWARVVADSTGCDTPALLDALYEYFATPAAWRLADGAEACARAFRTAGGKVVVVSNWDTRLRGLLEAMGATAWTDAIVVSGEEGVEKPDAEIFHRACRRIGLPPAQVVHVGDSYTADVVGARAIGMQALWFGVEVDDFDAVRRRVLADAEPEAG